MFDIWRDVNSKSCQRVATLFIACVVLATGSANLRANVPASISEVGEKVRASVVRITACSSTEDASGRGQSGNRVQVPKDSPFRDFFKQYFDSKENNSPASENCRFGTGVLVDSGDVIVTTSSVLGDANNVSVVFADGTQSSVDILGRDVTSDIAVLEPDTEKLTAVHWGNSDLIEVGDRVISVAAKGGTVGAATIGKITDAGGDDQGPYSEYIQADTAISDGSSGSPLFNGAGEVIGINTAVVNPSVGSPATGVWLPSNRVQKIVRQIVAHGEVRRGWIGVLIQPVSEEIAQAIGLDKPTGALLGGVVERGPAEEAGLREGDVVVSFDGNEIITHRDLPEIVTHTAPGTSVRVTVFRDGDYIDLDVDVGDSERRSASAPAGDLGKVKAGKRDRSPDSGHTVLGMTLQALNADLRRRYSIEDGVEGVVVTNVDPASAAAAKNIAAGEVIVEVRQDKVSQPSDVVRLVSELKEHGRRSALFLLSNGRGDVRFLAVRIDS